MAWFVVIFLGCVFVFIGVVADVKTAENDVKREYENEKEVQNEILSS